LNKTKESDVRLKSGQVLEISEGGDLNGLPVFTFHGTPGSRSLYPPHVENAENNGIHLIGFNRPGYGGSTRILGRDVLNGAHYASYIADNLGIEKFAVWGHSGGGKYALACAAALPGRVVAGSCMSTFAPFGAEGLDYFEGMGEANKEDIKLLLKDRKAWEEKSLEDVKTMAAPMSNEQNEMMISQFPEIDKKALTPELGNYLGQSIMEGLEKGPYGPIDDNLADVAYWGFDLGSIRVPTQIWHGKHDGFSPFIHGQWLAEHVPHTEAHLEENAGHLSIFVDKIPEVHAWLSSNF
jgi:pimeloyl-ACP methyl ester carboxylesterase